MPLDPVANLFADLPADARDEIVSVLALGAAVRVERIVSMGQASPPGFHYDQPHAEWVAVLAGSADLRFADEPAPRHLEAGDHVLIAPHRRHRVERTASPTIWLAVHFGEELDLGLDPGQAP